MLGDDDQIVANKEETLTEGYIENLNGVDIINNPPVLVSRRGKIVNGISDKDKKLSRGLIGGRAPAENEKYKMRSSDSGLGRTSMEGDSSSTERGSESSHDGVSRAIVAVKREEMARLEKELEQEMRYR